MVNCVDQRILSDPGCEVLPDISTLDAGSWKNILKGWYNRPEKKIVVKDTKLILRVPIRTEMWRKTRHSFIRDNAPFHWTKITSNHFVVLTNVNASFENTYDKAGIMIRESETNYISASLEWYEDKPHVSTCVTKDHTDWSLIPLAKNTEKAGIWLCIKRYNDYIETYYKYDMNDEWIPMRISKFSKEKTLHVGIYGANPLGKVDYRATFDFFNVIEY